MSLILHRAPRADLLVAGLAHLLKDPLPDAFEQELVLVPAKGVERWLSQQLSHRLGHSPGREDGVCAGVRFRSPASLVSELTGAREHDPWAPDALVWPLLSVVDASAGEAWCARAQRPPRARPAAARRATCGAVGATPWPDDWPAVRVVRRAAADPARRLGGRRRAPTGPGGALAGDLVWQPELWRRLVAEVGEPTPRRAPPRRRSPGCATTPARSTCRRGSRSSGTPGSR